MSKTALILGVSGQDGSHLAQLQQAAVSRDIEVVKDHLRNILPEFQV